MNSEKKYFSIGEISKIKKVTIKTLHYYHNIGLLVPAYIDEVNGYRYYSWEQFIHIDIIKIGRSMGGSIKEIQEIFLHEDMAHLTQFVKKKNKEIQEQINQLQETKSLTEMISAKFEQSQKNDKLEDAKVQYFPERYAITVPTLNEDDYQKVMDHIKLENDIDDYGVESKYEEGLIYELSTTDEVESITLFELIEDKDFYLYEDNPSFRKIPSGYFLTFTLSQGKEELEIKQMLKELREKKISVEFICSFDIYPNIFNMRQYYCQAQIYIGKNPPSL